MADQTDSNWPVKGHFEGDYWVEDSGYRVHRKWCDLLPGYYGPMRKDPDDGLGDIEFSNRMNEILGKITGVTGILDCASEIHATQFGIYVGYLYLDSSTDIPPCPVFWAGGGKQDNDSHYYMTGLIAGRAGRKIDSLEEPAIGDLLKNKVVLGAIAVALAGGTIGGPSILTFIMKSLVSLMGWS